MKKQLILIVITLLIPALGNLAAQTPKGDRTFAWSVDMAENDDYYLAFEFAQAACIQSSHLSVMWSELEPEEGVFSEDLLNLLTFADYFYPLNSTKIELQFGVTNTVIKTVPADLVAINYNDPVFIARYKTALDSIFTRIPNLELSSLNIGNESDILFGTDPDQYAAFKTFLNEVVPYAKSRYFELYGIDLKIGTTLTLYGLIDPIKSTLCADLNTGLDIVSVTYYPLEDDFTMKPPTEIEPDFDALIAIYNDPAQPIHFAECGYASSETCNSTPIKQAQFFSEVFRLWDKHYDYIKYLTIFKSTDWSYETIDYLRDYYGIDDPVFLEYLRTLGVRTWDGDGTNKLAYEFILCELDARDWCDITCPLSSLTKDDIVLDLTIKPNPFANAITLQTNQNLISVKLYSLTGELVLEAGTGIYQIDLSHLPNGIYLCEAQTENGDISRQKIVKCSN